VSLKIREILVTNDDGIDAEGIGVLVEAAAAFGRVTIVAPDREQSATSHAISLLSALPIERCGERRISVGGTPTDCVLLAVKGLLGDYRPDLVLSGVNHGSNMGDDITYSGTVAAAIEATLLGIPAIAFSVAARSDHLFETPARWIGPIVEEMRDHPPRPKTFWNVNFPNRPVGEVEGFRITHLGVHTYENSVIRDEGSGDREAYRIGGGELTWKEDPNADFHTVLRDRRISITPIHLDMTDRESIAEMRERRWGDRER